MSRPIPPLQGRRFGRLAVTDNIIRGAGGSRFVCICDCGNTTQVRAAQLIRGHTASCGCLRTDSRYSRRKHGAAAGGKLTPEYRAWMAMKARCADLSNPYYGGRGISVSSKWRDSFPAFLADMGPRPSPQHSIDRFPRHDGNYEPDNCRWATATEQARNRSTNSLVNLGGRIVSLAEACEVTGTNYDAAKYRVKVGRKFNRAVRRSSHVVS